MDDNYDGGALQRSITTLENQVGDLAYDVGVQAGRLDTRIDDVTKSLHAALSVIGDLASKLDEANRKIDRLERDLSYLEHNKIAQIERDVYGLESDLRSHGH